MSSCHSFSHHAQATGDEATSRDSTRHKDIRNDLDLETIVSAWWGRLGTSLPPGSDVRIGGL